MIPTNGNNSSFNAVTSGPNPNVRNPSSGSIPPFQYQPPRINNLTMIFGNPGTYNCTLDMNPCPPTFNAPAQRLWNVPRTMTAPLPRTNERGVQFDYSRDAVISPNPRGPVVSNSSPGVPNPAFNNSGNIMDRTNGSGNFPNPAFNNSGNSSIGSRHSSTPNDNPFNNSGTPSSAFNNFGDSPMGFGRYGNPNASYNSPGNTPILNVISSGSYGTLNTGFNNSGNPYNNPMSPDSDIEFISPINQLAASFRAQASSPNHSSYIESEED